jgi:hypothetical protein
MGACSWPKAAQYANSSWHVFAEKLSSEAPALRAVASLQRIPGGLPDFTECQEPESYRMSWTQPGKEGCTVWIYERRRK